MADRMTTALVDMVEAVRSLEYGRPGERSVEAMLREGRGTCSLKHTYLAAEIDRRMPELRPRIVHRVYRVERDEARELYGEEVAGAVPEEGLVDVHRYLTIALEGRRIVVDATFPGPAWDGRSPLPLACGPGEDHPAGTDPDADKARLQVEHCDPAVREPFIEALGRAAVKRRS